MDFATNKKSVEIIKECAFGGTYFRDIFLLALMVSGIENHGKNLMF